MAQPHDKDDTAGRTPVSIEHLEGDIFVVQPQPDPEIPSGSARHCPQCGRRAWLRSRFCWHCSFDFGARWTATHWVMLLVGFANLAAALALALFLFTASGA